MYDESEGYMMIEHASYDKLIGVTTGNYRLEQFIGQGKLGPVFLARTNGATTTCLLRFLVGPTNPNGRERDVYLERFQHQASQIAILRHPYILPLLGYGTYRGIPYLVSPHIAMRSLRTRLAKSGPLDVFAVGRYLDQVAAMLEYAHQHGVLHGDLTVDCIFIRLDGQLAVADVGVIDLLGLNTQDAQQDWLREGSEVYAPEQLLGKPAGPYTDVYALGAVLYHLLTGSPVFTGNTPDELAQQHLYASIPPLAQRRTDLPAGLYSIIARALAKDPAQRFRQPGALANAYHRIVDPHNGTRVPFVVPPSHEVQTQGPLALAAALPDVQLSELDSSNNGSAAVDWDHSAQRPALRTPFPSPLPPNSTADPFSQPDGPRPSLLRRLRRKHVRRNMLIAVLLLLLLVASGTVGITFITQQGRATAGLAGQVMLFDAQNGPPGRTDALTIVVHGLDVPPAGFQYAAWLINDQSEVVIPLGTLTAKQQTFSQTYAGESTNGQAGTNLLAGEEKLEITLEQGTVKLPAGKEILSGTFPPMAFAHIQHLLVSFPATPGKVGMLVGMLEQTHLLNIQADVLQSLVASGNTVAIGCVAQSMIDLIEGTQGHHYRPLAAMCARQNVTATADGFGLLGNGYLAGAAEHATLAISQSDATSTMRLHAGLMATALSNIKGWVTTVDQDAFTLRDNPVDLTKVQEMATLADQAYHGVDTNGDGQIDPVAGEGGALTAYQQGQLMATLSLAPSA